MSEEEDLDDLVCRAPIIGVGARGASVVTCLPTSRLLKTIIVTDELTDLRDRHAEVVVKSVSAQLSLPGFAEEGSGVEKFLANFLVGQRLAVVVGALGDSTTFELVVDLVRHTQGRVGRVVGIFSMPAPFEGSEVTARAATQAGEVSSVLDLFIILPISHLFRSMDSTSIASAIWRLEETMRLAIREIVEIEEVGHWHVCQLDGSSRLEEHPRQLKGVGMIGIHAGDGARMDPSSVLSAMTSSWLGGANLAESKQLVVASKHGPDQSDPLQEFLPDDHHRFWTDGIEATHPDRLHASQANGSPLVLVAVGFEDLSFLNGRVLKTSDLSERERRCGMSFEVPIQRCLD